jgi:hypothetical protein
MRVIEASIMIAGIGFIVYYLLNQKKKNVHLSNGRPYIAIVLSIGWSCWTYSIAYADYKYFFEMQEVLMSTTLYRLCAIELLNIAMTVLNAMMLLGNEFKWLKKDK